MKQNCLSERHSKHSKLCRELQGSICDRASSGSYLTVQSLRLHTGHPPAHGCQSRQLPSKLGRHHSQEEAAALLSAAAAAAVCAGQQSDGIWPCRTRKSQSPQGTMTGVHASSTWAADQQNLALWKAIEKSQSQTNYK